jgi:hypothetical protein
MDSVSCKRIPIWYELKLLFIAWLALPNFRGAAFIYDKFVREQLRKHGLTSAAASGKKDDGKSSSPSSKDKDKPKSKFLAFVTPKKVSSSAADSALATPAHHDFFFKKYFLSLAEDIICVFCLNVAGS